MSDDETPLHELFDLDLEDPCTRWADRADHWRLQARRWRKRAIAAEARLALMHAAACIELGEQEDP